MDQFKKRLPKEFLDMEKQLGRMLRNMSHSRMVPYQTCDNWLPAADIYETETELLICVELAGVHPEEVSVVAESRQLVISGSRRFPIVDNPSSVHQLELEHGRFERTIFLPVPVDVSATTSQYRDGLLVIRLPKPQPKGKIDIKVT